MCGRFTLTSSGADLARHFELARVPELAPRFNIAPTQPVAVVRRNAAGDRVLNAVRWGLIPHWASDPSVGNRMINARCETAATKPAFRDALRRRRCLVPSDGFYEWGGVAGSRVPHLFQRTGGGPFAMAGLWERWRHPDGSAIDSCTIVTTEANAAVRGVHERMPVVLEPRDYALWLDRDVQSPERVLPLLVPAPADAWEALRVGTHVNDVKNDDPACIEPAIECYNPRR